MKDGTDELETVDPSSTLRELADGVVYWRDLTNWPSDFHNADYEQWVKENPHGAFTLEWWEPFLARLRTWIATRPVASAVLTKRFTAAMPTLTEAWQETCEAHFDADIATVTWEQVAAFPQVVETIKPMKQTPSAVFTSKFCHFLLPRVFPVVDNEALGNNWASYEHYFRFVQAQWLATPPEVQHDLVAALTKRIEETGATVVPGFPMANKIVELRLMGRRYPRLDGLPRWTRVAHS
jgi:hypothetical protein